MSVKPRILVARRVPPAVAARAQREFDAVLADVDMDADTVIGTDRPPKSGDLQRSEGSAYGSQYLEPSAKRSHHRKSQRRL